MARRAGGPPYVCWSHGEDLATAGLSRELKLVTRMVLRGAAASLANSRNTAALLRNLGVPESGIRVAHPGVDAARFHPGVDGTAVRRRLALGEEDVLLLSVGRLQLRKGHDLTIRAVAQLAAELPRLRYAIVGTGEEEARLRELARAAGVADRVTFAGSVGDEDLPAWYAAADVFVLANRREGEDIEGFGIVFLEAQAAERPVVAGSSGGAPEAIADGETGMLVSGTDAAELAAVLRRLAASRELRARMGSAARERVRSRFTWEHAAAIVGELVRDLEAR
jgi:phosphatidylinositol alpha-1,6-mannosyltransferase